MADSRLLGIAGCAAIETSFYGKLGREVKTIKIKIDCFLILPLLKK